MLRHMKSLADNRKFIEAIVYVASRMPGIRRFYASEALYYADREHFRSHA